MNVILLSHDAVAMKPGSNVNIPWSFVRPAMFKTSGPNVPLFTSAVDFLPVARFVNSNFFSDMGAISNSLGGDVQTHFFAGANGTRRLTRHRERIKRAGRSKIDTGSRYSTIFSSCPACGSLSG